MSNFDPNAPEVSKAFLAYSSIVEKRHALEAKSDPESQERFNDLLDELMCADMSLGPLRKAMATGQKPDEPAESDTDQ